MFRTYVGAGPKWVIMRYRLQEAVSELDEGKRDWARLAADLGYFDQAHFVRDFKALLGKTPTEYVNEGRIVSAGSLKSELSMERRTPSAEEDDAVREGMAAPGGGEACSTSLF